MEAKETINTEDPCKDCPNRKWYAKKFDMHFWGADCPYECKKYELYKQQEKLKELKRCY